MSNSPEKLHSMDPPKAKEKRQGFDEGTSSMVPSAQASQGVHLLAISKYQGVIPLRNGDWEAKIIVDDRNIFLGTFESEVAAARAYDSAALKIFNDDFIRNFLITEITIHEPRFQASFSYKDTLDMISKGSYEPKFIEFVSNILRSNYSFESDTIVLPSASDFIDGIFIKEMFHKELTRSDDGEQNMFILPTDRVLEYFSNVMCDEEEMLLTFQDKKNQSWVFRLDYLNDIDKHVFTTGWKDFVNQMELHANDIVVLYRCTEWGESFGDLFDMIDFIRVYKKEDKSKQKVNKSEEQPKIKVFGKWISG